jgi:glycerophosphoryl diester phosphodiesterase
MRNLLSRLSSAAAFAVLTLSAHAVYCDDDSRFHNGRDDDWYDGRGFFDKHGQKLNDPGVQLGTRPFYLVEGLDEGKLKDRLKRCENGPFYRSRFSIGHRGAAQQFPEHTKEAYQAGARMGAGIIECDTTFTKDRELVCRHDECDLHTTTDIVTTPLNAKCSVPWAGPASQPKCCTSDLTLSEFKSLRGKMDASTPGAATPEAFLLGTPDWRTDLYTGRGTLMTLKESIALNQALGVKHTPELKAGNAERIKAVFGSQANYAQKMIDTLKAAGVDPTTCSPSRSTRTISFTGSRTSPSSANRPSTWTASIPPSARRFRGSPTISCSS